MRAVLLLLSLGITVPALADVNYSCTAPNATAPTFRFTVSDDGQFVQGSYDSIDQNPSYAASNVKIEQENFTASGDQLKFGFDNGNLHDGVYYNIELNGLVGTMKEQISIDCVGYWEYTHPVTCTIAL